MQKKKKKKKADKFWTRELPGSRKIQKYFYIKYNIS